MNQLQTEKWIARHGVELTHKVTKSSIKVYSFDELTSHLDDYAMTTDTAALFAANFVRPVLRDLQELNNRLNELEQGGGFVRKDELKSYVFKNQ